MTEQELTELMQNSQVNLSIPVYKCFLALLITTEKIDRSQDVFTSVFYGVEASYLINSIIDAIPESKEFFETYPSPTINALVNKKTQAYPLSQQE